MKAALVKQAGEAPVYTAFTDPIAGDGMVRVRDVRRNTQSDVSTGELIDLLVTEVSERRPE